MSIIVNNTDNQLNINNNGVLDVYAVRSIKSVSRGVDASGNYYIAINFIANDKNNSLRIYLKDVSSPITWTNDLTGVNAALADIRDWLSEIIEVQISEANDSILVYGWDGTTNRKIKTDASGVLAIQDNGGSITVDGGTGVQRTATFLRPSGSNGTVGPNIYSASFASVGTANAIVGGINLKPGETLNFDAGAINNTLAAITYNTLTNAGAELIIITLT
jgi:hypothetical protein